MGEIGKTLLIVGGSSDIAMEYIRCYHDRYDTIIATYYTHKELLDELTLLPELNRKLIPNYLNLREEGSVCGLKEFLDSRELRPQYMMFLSAGRTTYAKLEDMDLRAVNNEFELQTLSFLELMRELVPSMKEQRFGRIGVVLSSVTKSAVALNTSYMVNKYALLGAVKALSAELASSKITVNAVSPSMVDTKFIEGKSPFVIKKNMDASPLKRLASPHDVARALAFIMDDENEFITGENIAVTGGSVK